MSSFLNFMRNEINQIRPKLLIPHGMSQIAVNMLEERYDVTQCKYFKPWYRTRMLSHVRGMNGLIWTDALELDKEFLNAAGPCLRVITTLSSDYDHIDIKEALKRNIKVGCCKISADGPANMAILLMLAAIRKLHEGRTMVERGEWTGDFNILTGLDLEDSTVGIVGFGYIGQAISQRLKAFDIKNLLYTDKRKLPSCQEDGAIFTPLEGLVKHSDVVIISCALNDQTKGMFDGNIFRQMKDNSVLVNVARGEIVDQDALVQALKYNKLFAAGLDVTVPNHLPKGNELLKLPNAVLSPHLGSSTVLQKREASILAAENIIAGLENRTLPCPVLSPLLEDECNLLKFDRLMNECCNQ